MIVIYGLVTSHGIIKPRVQIYDEAHHVATLWFRWDEQQLAERCAKEAENLQDTDDDTIRAFRFKWSAIRADMDTTPYSRGVHSRKVMWHTEANRE